MGTLNLQRLNRDMNHKIVDADAILNSFVRVFWNFLEVVKDKARARYEGPVVSLLAAVSFSNFGRFLPFAPQKSHSPPTHMSLNPSSGLNPPNLRHGSTDVFIHIFQAFQDLEDPWGEFGMLVSSTTFPEFPPFWGEKFPWSRSNLPRLYIYIYISALLHHPFCFIPPTIQ